MTDLTSNTEGEEIGEERCSYEPGLGKDLPRAAGRAGRNVGRVCGQPPPACVPAGDGGAPSEAGGRRCPGARCSPRSGDRAARCRASSETTSVLLSDVLVICSTLSCFTDTSPPDNKPRILLKKKKKGLLCVEGVVLDAILFNAREAATPAFFLLTVRP